MAEITITPARYVKRQFAVSCPSDSSGFKTRAMRLCDHLKARYSRRERAYIMSGTKVEKLKRLYAAGYDATSISLRLTAPDGGLT